AGGRARWARAATAMVERARSRRWARRAASALPERARRRRWAGRAAVVVVAGARGRRVVGARGVGGAAGGGGAAAAARTGGGEEVDGGSADEVRGGGPGEGASGKRTVIGSDSAGSAELGHGMRAIRPRADACSAVAPRSARPRSTRHGPPGRASGCPAGATV